MTEQRPFAVNNTEFLTPKTPKQESAVRRAPALARGYQEEVKRISADRLIEEMKHKSVLTRTDNAITRVKRAPVTESPIGPVVRR